MEKDRLSREQIVEVNEGEVAKLLPFLPWLESKTGTSVASTYEDNGVKESSVCFPVYDSTLLNFVKTAKQTEFIDKNYVYVYTKYRIRSAADEKRTIQRATLQEMNVLWGILSKYIIQGSVKGGVWAEGVRNGIFLSVVHKMKELMEFWDKPMA